MPLQEALSSIAGNDIIIGSLLISLTVFAMILLIYYAKKYIYRKANKRKGVSTKLLMRFETPVIMLAIILSAEIVITKILNEQGTYISIAEHINSSLIIIAITYTLMLLTDILLQNWSNNMDKERRSRTHQEVLPLMKSVKNIVMSILASLLILQAWGIQITGIAASIGVVGVILSFIYKDTLANVFSGLSMIFDDSFQKGDLVELADGEIGYIEEINLRSTKIRNFDNEEVIVPNSIIAGMKIKNYAHPTKSIRIKVNFSVVYGSDSDNVHKVILKLLRNEPNVLKYPAPKVYFVKMAEYSLDFTALFYIKNYTNMYKIKSDMIGKIYKELNKNNIKIPFPTRTLYYGNEKSKSKK